MKIMESTTTVGGSGGVAGAEGERLNDGIQEDDMADGFTCSKHPYRANTNPGGICAFCLQEKLGKLVSSSSSLSFRSDIAGLSTDAGASISSASISLAVGKASTNGGNDCHFHEYNNRRAIIPFLLDHEKKKITSSDSDRASSNIVFNRSKSTATPRRSNFFFNRGDDYNRSSKRGWFWSILHFSKRIEKGSKNAEIVTMATPPPPSIVESSINNGDAFIVGSNERKVSRSRSVGCGSRSFRGDLFERISTGFGDCTLRRVESNREGKSQAVASSAMKERVRCGGIFSGFIMAYSSSSSSSSSRWVSSSAEETVVPAGGKTLHGRSRSWGWAFSSPMRGFGKGGKRDIIRQAGDNTTATATTATTTNMSATAIHSLLRVK